MNIQEADFRELNHINFVNEDTLKKIGQMVCDDYDRDFQSRSEWSRKRANWLRIFMQKVDGKNFPWKNSSNIPYPALTQAIIQFQARAYEALMPSKNKIKAARTGVEDEETARRVEKHMNFQLDYDMEEFEEGFDFSLFQLPINGSIFRKTYYDNLLQRNVSQYCGADEVVVNYLCSPNKQPDRITHVLYLSPNDIATRALTGIFANTDKLKKDEQVKISFDNIKSGSQDAVSQTQTDIKQKSDDIDGIQPDIEEVSLVFLEQHRLWDLNGDGIAEPYTFTVDKESQTVVRVKKNYFYDYNNNLKIVDYFTHYYFFPNPEGFYGLGFGHILEGLNEAAKALLDQIIDAGTLSNLSGKMGFFNKRSGIGRGDLSFELGEFKGVDIPVEDIRKAIYAFEFGGASPVLFSVLGFLNEQIQGVTTVSDIMSGGLPRSDTPATAIVNSIEQGMKVFSSIHKRIHRTFKKELKKMFILNSIYTDNQKYLKILGETWVNRVKAMLGIGINALQDYASDIDVIPVSDPNITSRAERMAVAEQLYMQGMQNPIIAGNPANVETLSRLFFETLAGDVVDVNTFMQPAEPPSPPDLSPVEEEALWLKEQGTPALPQQDHIAHIQSHEAFGESAFANELTPQGKKLMDAHKKEHISFQYLKENQPQQQPMMPMDMGMGMQGMM